MSAPACGVRLWSVANTDGTYSRCTKHARHTDDFHDANSALRCSVCREAKPASGLGGPCARCARTMEKCEGCGALIDVVVTDADLVDGYYVNHAFAFDGGAFACTTCSTHRCAECGIEGEGFHECRECFAMYKAGRR